MNYEEMSDFEINWKVAEHLDLRCIHERGGSVCYQMQFGGSCMVDYCNNPSDAWQIIFANKIRVSPVMYMSDDNGEYLCTGEWEAGTLWSGTGAFYNSKYHACQHDNPLRAAMIVFLMMQEQDK